MPELKNARHELFSQNVAKGMPADAAYVAAGYDCKNEGSIRGNASTLRSKKIVAARIEEIQKIATEKAVEEVKYIILSKQEVQAWWSKMVMGKEHFSDMKERLKASELLGKSEAWFTEKHEHSVDRKLEDILAESWGEKK